MFGLGGAGELCREGGLYCRSTSLIEALDVGNALGEWNDGMFSLRMAGEQEIFDAAYCVAHYAY